MFNESLWRDIALYGTNFWEEFSFYSKQKFRIVNFCSKIFKSIKLGSQRVEEVLNLKETLVVPESPWGREYTIDHVWCLVSKLNMRVFRNIIRVHEFPELCSSLSQDSHQMPLTDFQKNRTDPEVMMNSAFCSGKRTPENRTFQIPQDVLLATDLYNIWWTSGIFEAFLCKFSRCTMKRVPYRKKGGFQFYQYKTNLLNPPWTLGAVTLITPPLFLTPEPSTTNSHLPFYLTIWSFKCYKTATFKYKCQSIFYF